METVTMAPKAHLFRLVICILLAISECLSVSLPTRSLDWAFNDKDNINWFYLVSGDNYYKFDLYRREKGSGKVSDLFPGLPSGIQAATWWPGQDKYYFFKDGKYYYADNIGGSVSGSFEGSSLGDIFTRPIDAAVTLRGKTYFFQNSYLYEFSGDRLNRDVKAETYKLPQKIDAAIAIYNAMFVFKGDTTWSVFPYRSSFITRSYSSNKIFFDKSFNFG